MDFEHVFLVGAVLFVVAIFYSSVGSAERRDTLLFLHSSVFPGCWRLSRRRVVYCQLAF